MKITCSLIVKDKDDCDKFDLDYCCCDGSWCMVSGDFEKCRLNLPIDGKVASRYRDKKCT